MKTIKKFFEKIQRNKWTWLIFFVIDFIFFSLMNFYFTKICILASKEPLYFKTEMHTTLAIMVHLNFYLIFQLFIIGMAQRDLKRYFQRKEQQNDYINNN